MLYYTILFYTILYYTILYYTTLSGAAEQRGAACAVDLVCRIVRNVKGSLTKRNYNFVSVKIKQIQGASQQRSLEDGREPEHVHGDGVIGFFPILTDIDSSARSLIVFAHS